MEQNSAAGADAKATASKREEAPASFLERNKTLTSAIVSIVIAAIGFASAMTVSYIQRQSQADREEIAAATDLDTSAILLNRYAAEVMGARAAIGNWLKNDNRSIRIAMADMDSRFEMRDKIDEMIARGLKLSQDLWTRLGENSSPIRRDMVNVMISFDQLMLHVQSLRSGLSYPLEAWPPEQRPAQVLILALDYDSIEPVATRLLCDIAVLHETFGHMFDEADRAVAEAWIPFKTVEGCKSERPEAITEIKNIVALRGKAIQGQSLADYVPDYSQ